MNEFALDIMKRLDLPEDAKALFIKIADKLSANEKYALCKKNRNFDDDPWMKAMKEIEAIAEEIGEHPYSVAFTFLLECTEDTYAAYKEKGIPDEIYYNTIMDFKYKFDECLTTKGVYGTFVGWWFNRHLRLDLFGLGRLQYTFGKYPHERYEKDGKVINKGDNILTVHIPSSGDMSKEKRDASYAMAPGFFKKYFDYDAIAFGCDSWLFYEEHRNFLPPESNIISFMNEYYIVSRKEYEGFPDGWRIFGTDKLLPYEDLPENSTLQREYKKLLLAGKTPSVNYGVKFI